MHGVGCRVQDLVKAHTEHEAVQLLLADMPAPGLGLRVEGLGFRVHGSGRMFQG